MLLLDLPQYNLSQRPGEVAPGDCEMSFYWPGYLIKTVVYLLMEVTKWAISEVYLLM